MSVIFQFIFLIAFFPCILFCIKENEELLQVEKDRHSSGFLTEGSAKQLVLEFPEQLNLIIGSKEIIQFTYRGNLTFPLKLIFDFDHNILNLTPNYIVLNPGIDSTGNFSVIGLSLSSRTFIDLKECYFINGSVRVGKCPFEHGNRSLIPVLLNDVVFSAQALFACLITAFQCFIYERGTQRISYTCRLWASILLGFSSLSLFLALIHLFNWLDFINYLSYVKMAVTMSKYFPQAILNFQRKSTVGWSIGNVLLDATGGVMDIFQMILQAKNTDDWSAFTGNPVKFGLGFISIIFDALFILQHYVLYPHKDNDNYNQVSNPSLPVPAALSVVGLETNREREEDNDQLVLPD
ncbi:hypothetical protein Mgra_00004995 [Meloidogyne graminicola]|uniref:Cystinosin n=1 Tax=Meloidogyne graminicola TaxID=189291 RepID=A0A8S9ZQQ3_9BILA|nr:hypothetical protein Mgra_00004995 [Meloidogyne graminicola]